MEVVERRSRVMASELHLIGVGSDRDGVADALDDAVRYIEHLESCWSRFLPGSDIGRLNRLAADGGGVLAVDPSTIVLVQAMVQGVELTAGRFDPTLLGTVHPPTLRGLVADGLGEMVAVPAGLALDPGGIGKGLAADLAVERLLRSGTAGALVSVGGDLAAAGVPPSEHGWVVDIEDPEDATGVLVSVAVSGGGIATSVAAHTHDPSAGDLEAVTVAAPTGWRAEVHATAALASGSGSVLAYLEHHDLSGIAVRADHTCARLLATDDLRSCLPADLGGGR